MLRSKDGTRMMAGSLNRLVRNGRTASRESGPPRLNRTIAVRVMRRTRTANLRTPYRHGRAWHDHPRVCLAQGALAQRNSWMVGPSPTMTEKGGEERAKPSPRILAHQFHQLRDMLRRRL